MPTTIATIGFGKKGAERFMALLKQAGVDTIVDTRRRPDSPLAGYARRRDLPFLLEKAAGIGYEHRSELAPSNELLDGYRSGRDWDSYVREFEAEVLNSDDGIAVMRELLARTDRVALLCSEPTPQNCHRRLVAERMRELEPTLEIVHLV